jgi:hypothetical protein
MNHKQKEQGKADDASGKHPEENDAINSLPKMEMYAILGLELGQRILEKLQKVEDSLEILAAQKARELNPEKPEGEMTS